MINITTLPQLNAFARGLLPMLKAGGVYGLEGELGAGKTTFVKHLASALGVKDDVISPTFIYHQTYLLPVALGDLKRLHHYDLYRLASDTDASALGLEFDDPEAAHLVEWIEHAPELRARATKTFRFEIQPDGHRTVTVETL